MKGILVKKSCKECNIIFEYRLTKRTQNRKFCCSHCAKINNGKSNKGRKKTYEQRTKLSDMFKGDKNPFYGKKHTEESNRKIGKANTWDESRFRYCNFNEKEKEILDGIMLGDGCLSEKSRISARLTFGFKFKETCDEILKNLTSINFSPLWQSSKTGCWHTKSNMYHDLLAESNRWYKGKKIVPTDIIVSKLSCYWWYIGDGYLSRNNVYLCTDSFSCEDIEILLSKLKYNGFNPSITSKKRIRFNKKDSIKFLNWIVPEDGIMEHYKYKWNIT